MRHLIIVFALATFVAATAGLVIFAKLLGSGDIGALTIAIGVMSIFQGCYQRSSFEFS